MSIIKIQFENHQFYFNNKLWFQSSKSTKFVNYLYHHYHVNKTFIGIRIKN